MTTYEEKIMKRMTLFAVILTIVISGDMLFSDPVPVNSTITSVKLFTNRAEITRTARLNLKKGLNTVLIEGLPDNLYDWSVKGTLPEKFTGRIMSIEISKTALIEKKRKNIQAIEKKLEELREGDSVFTDDLSNLRQQENFLDSVTKFTEQEASKELTTRLPQTAVWSSTMEYISQKRKAILSSRRDIHKKRRDLAKEIQKLEFDLSRIAGRTYYSSYMKLDQAIQQNAASMEIQQYGNLTDQYEVRERSLTESQTGIDTEKRLMLTIFSSAESEADFSLSYLIPDTFWKMKYDFRASRNKNEVEVIVYSDIYQKTGEDWNNVNLSLSTWAPLSNINLPNIPPWYLDIRTEYKRSRMEGAPIADKAYSSKKLDEESFTGDEAPIPETAVTSKGVGMEISFPLKQTIESSQAYQKKYLKSYTVKTGKDLSFFYQMAPEMSAQAYLMALVKNNTELPWLAGEAQVFLENEYAGKINIPDTPINAERELVLGIDPSVKSGKELVRKYEDKAGLFGGNRKIIYSYKITIENSTRESKNVTILDNIPVSRNSEIKVDIEKLSLEPLSDDETKKSSDYARGIRKFVLDLTPGSKREITYDVVVIFNKDLNISGLK